MHLTYSREDALEDLAEVGAAVVQHGLAEGSEHLWGHGGRPRREQVSLLWHRPEPSGLSGSHYALAVEALIAFGAALLTLRLSGLLATRWRERRSPHLLAWSAGLAAYALGAAAIAWGAAAGWNAGNFRVYYLFGGLLTAPLLGAGSLLGAGRGVAGPVVLVYAGLATGVALGVPLESPVGGSAIPEAQEHLAFFPARILALVGNITGTVALVGVSVATLRHRPVGNTLLLCGFALAAAGSALSGLGVTGSAVSVAVAAVLLYAGTVTPR